MYTYIGSTANQDIEFYLDKPLLPGTYGLYAENSSDLGYTNYLSLGDPYVGVSVSGGVLQFTDQSAFDANYARLNAAYEDHQADFFNSHNSLSDDDIDALIISTGFDEHQPLEEFEAYWGINTLRSLIKGEVDTWLRQPHADMSTYPENNYHSNDVIAQTMVSTSGAKVIGEGTVVIPVTMGPTIPSDPGPNSCMFDASEKEYEDYSTSRSVKKTVAIVSVASNLTNIIGEAKTFKKVGGLYWRAAQRIRTDVYGIMHDGNCVLVGPFRTGHNNSGNDRKRLNRNHYVVASSRTIKTGEMAMNILIQGQSNPFSITYTH